MRVRVYRNLNKRCWSVKRMEPGPSYNRVIEHASSVELADVTFIVSEAGRQRAIRDGRRNVHAYAQGTLVALNGERPKDMELYEPFTYRPFDHKRFHTIGPIMRKHDRDINRALVCYFMKNMTAWAKLAV